MKRNFCCALIAALTGFLTGSPLLNAATDRPNVLFIAVDDLRPELGCYGNKLIQSPNIDALAARGLLFNRAYCQQAVCSPSRTSLLTGRRPDTTRVYDLETHFRAHLPDVIPLPQWFKQHGWHAQGLSKIYHGGLDDALSWSVPHWSPRGSGYGPAGQQTVERRKAEARQRGQQNAQQISKIKGPPWEAPDVADNALPDGQTADRAIEVLREIKEKPFFLAVGFLRPHLPFVAPKKYWDLYDPQALKLAPNPFAPTNCPKYALTEWGELRAYTDIPQVGPLTAGQARTMIHGYCAAVSYMDAQLGRVLAELEKLGLRGQTIVILWGDHGWQLGEHGLWCKHTNFEIATRAPLLVSVPGQKSAGRKTEALVEFVDIYPTLAELCGLPLPEGLEGTSFKPLLDDPRRPWKTAAFSQYPRNIPGQGRGMGYSLRTDRYRLTEWSVTAKAFREYELYDYQTDPQGNDNLAVKPESAANVRELAGLLHQGWRAALPPGRK